MLLHLKALKLGYKDSNLEMTESESVALPFGDSPLVQSDAIFTTAKTIIHSMTNFVKHFL